MLSAYTCGSLPSRMTSSSQARSRSSTSRAPSHHTSGWNQNSACTTMCIAAVRLSRRRTCASSCARIASTCSSLRRSPMLRGHSSTGRRIPKTPGSSEVSDEARVNGTVRLETTKHLRHAAVLENRRFANDGATRRQRTNHDQQHQRRNRRSRSPPDDRQRRGQVGKKRRPVGCGRRHQARSARTAGSITSIDARSCGAGIGKRRPPGELVAERDERGERHEKLHRRRQPDAVAHLRAVVRNASVSSAASARNSVDCQRWFADRQSGIPVSIVRDFVLSLRACEASAPLPARRRASAGPIRSGAP